MAKIRTITMKEIRDEINNGKEATVMVGKSTHKPEAPKSTGTTT